MKHLNYLKQVISLLCIVSLTIGCKTTVPANDTTLPKVTVSVVDTSGTDLIASSDPTTSLVSFTCPAGTDNAGDVKTSYVTNVENSTVDFRVIASDKGGVKYMFVNIFNEQVSNVRLLNTSGITPQITTFGTQTRISVTFTSPKTLEILAFEISNGGSGIVLETSTRDFSDNIASIPEINTNGPRVQVLDVSICND